MTDTPSDPTDSASTFILTDEDGSVLDVSDVDKITMEGMQLAYALAAVCDDKDRMDDLAAAVLARVGPVGFGYVAAAALTVMAEQLLSPVYTVAQAATGHDFRAGVKAISEGRVPDGADDRRVHVALEDPQAASMVEFFFGGEERWAATPPVALLSVAERVAFEGNLEKVASMRGLPVAAVAEMGYLEMLGSVLQTAVAAQISLAQLWARRNGREDLLAPVGGDTSDVLGHDGGVGTTDTLSVDPQEENMFLLPSGVVDVNETSALGVRLGREVIAMRSDPAAVLDLIGGVMTTQGATGAALILAAALAKMAAMVSAADV
jgi:hypothetical protein